MQSTNDKNGFNALPEGVRQANENISKYCNLNIDQLKQELYRIRQHGLELSVEMRECDDPEQKSAIYSEALNWMLRGQQAEMEMSVRIIDAQEKKWTEKKNILIGELERLQNEFKTKASEVSDTSYEEECEEEQSTHDQSDDVGHEQEKMDGHQAYMEESKPQTTQEPPQEGEDTSMMPPVQLVDPPSPRRHPEGKEETETQTEMSKKQRMMWGEQSLQHLTPGDSGHSEQEPMEGPPADMEERKMEHHTTPEEPQVAEGLDASTTTMYPQQLDHQIPSLQSLPFASLEPQVVVDGSPSSQTSGNKEADGSNRMENILRSEWNYDHLSQEFAEIGKGDTISASLDRSGLGAGDGDKIGTTTFLAENGDHDHPRVSSIPYRSRRFRTIPAVPPFAGVTVPRRYTHELELERRRVIDNERQTKQGHGERSLMDRLADKFKGGRRWIGEKLQNAAEVLFTDSSDYDHHPHLHENLRQQLEAQADVPSSFGNMGPAPAGLLLEEIRETTPDHSLGSGHFRRCVEPPSCEDPSIRLEPQVYPLEFIVINTSCRSLGMRKHRTKIAKRLDWF
jgi:hypothetical protein